MSKNGMPRTPCASASAACATILRGFEGLRRMMITSEDLQVSWKAQCKNLLSNPLSRVRLAVPPAEKNPQLARTLPQELYGDFDWLKTHSRAGAPRTPSLGCLNDRHRYKTKRHRAHQSIAMHHTMRLPNRRHGSPDERIKPLASCA